MKPLARVTIDASLNYYVSVGKAKAVKVAFSHFFDTLRPLLRGQSELP